MSLLPPDVCVGLRLQQVMKSQWQNKSLERSKPLKKLSLKHKLTSSKEKHKFTNSLMAVSKWMERHIFVGLQVASQTETELTVDVSTGLGHFKNRVEKLRPADGGLTSGGSSSAAASRLEGQGLCKTERLQAVTTPLGPYDKSCSRKRLREHSLDRSDCECQPPHTPQTHPRVCSCIHNASQN